MIRRDFFDIVEHAVANRVGVKFSTNGAFIGADQAARLAEMDDVDVQISLDGATAEVNDRVRGEGSYALARRAMDNLAAAGFGPFKISVVLTRHNAEQLEAYEALAAGYGAELRITRLRPAGRALDTWHELRPDLDQMRAFHRWLLDRPGVLTGDSFFHLNALGEGLPGLNMCGAGRIVCLVDPVGDVYACPFILHPEFRAGSVRDPGGFTSVWRESALFAELRSPTQPIGSCSGCPDFEGCGSGCLAAKFFTGMPLAGPDPECVHGAGDGAAAVPGRRGPDHSRGVPVHIRSRSGERLSV
jgi:mycofactocin radical SAM maturase